VKDRFHLIEFIGCGGMGDVFMAEDQRRIDAQDIDTQLAIKVLNNNFRDHPDSLRSLQREARKTQNLAHPNIVNVFDFDRDQHHVFMTMELMRGQPLNKVIKANPHGLALEIVFRYVAEMGAALSYAHSGSVIHSDFKPSNIFLDQDTIKVFDFGIARAAKEGHVDDFDAGDLGALTPTYASPEMLEGEQQADPKDDIYASACITYELLTGKHPFIEKGKKVPADQARNKGLSPVPVKKLKRKQWKALKQGLSFDPSKRTPSVKQFLAEFLPEQQQAGFINKWYMWPVAATVLSALAYLPARDFWEEKQLDDFANDLKSGSEEDVLALLVHLENLPEEEQLSYFNDARVKSSLTQFFIGQMNEQIDGDEYIEAERSAQRALSIYEDSRRLSDQRELVSKRKAARLNELNIQLNSYLNTELAGFIEIVDQFPKLFAAIQRVDSKNPMLEDQRVPDRMAEVLEWLAQQQQFQRGQEVSAIAKSMFPSNSSISVAAEQLSQQQYRFEQANKITQLEQSLALFPSINRVEDLEPFSASVGELNKIGPDSRVLIQFKQHASPLIEQALEAQFKQGQWFSAERQFEQFQGFLIESAASNLQQQLERGKAQYQDALEKEKQRITSAITQGELAKAETMLASFEAPADVKDATSLRLGRAWLTQARVARNKLAWEEATALVERARSVSASLSTPNDSFTQTLDNELELISASQSAVSPAQLEQLNAQRKAEVESYQKELNSLLGHTANPALLTEVQTVLDKIEQLQPNHKLLSDIPQRLSSRYLNQVDQLEKQGELQQASELLRAYSEAFPGNASIDERSDALQKRLIDKESSERYQQVKQEIDQQLKRIAQDPNWEAQLRKLIKQLKALDASEAQITALNTMVALNISNAANQYTQEKRFDDALELLAKATEYDATLGTLKGQEQHIKEAQAAWDAEKQARKQQAQVEGLKQTLLTQLKANDISRAEQSLGKLTAQLGKADPYIQSEAHPAFVETYLRLAEQLARQSRLTKAAQLLEGAKKYSVDTTVIDEKIAAYQRDAKLWRIGQTIRSVDLESFIQAHQMLTEIEAELVPERAEKLHTDLANAVINRYEALKASRPSSARSLLLKAKELYPDHSKIKSIALPAAQYPEPIKPTEPVQPVKPEPTEPEPVVQKPKVEAPKVTATGKACSSGLAGLGRNVKAVCYDMVSAQTKAPYMIVIPSGAGPTFAISKFEISIDDYNAYCQQTGCKARSGSGRSPLTNISHSQVNAYAKWLTQVTGKQYKLPSYEQWKHAALSGGKRQPNNFNCRLMQGETILKGHGQVSVRSGEANNWGMINYLGNVQEWVLKGGAVMAAGGHYADKMSTCSVDLVRSSGANSKTGFRLVRQL
jgi:serine/threonine protein kinase